MYLKSITLKGFKSFPDRTQLEFGPGVSVIVGPNGSGKSNVTDAVLWALGEQSPLAVRGQSMQDVIFGGAPGRQAASSAEVELVLDDADSTLSLGAPEVSIVRRLDRTGEGEYRLAGARCRLVDVIELLSDTGLGKEMHSVISQGRVEAIVTSKPRDRRLLIEEAAGLGKHRKRRRRAQLKLARTQDNLDRALDVEREARSRLRPLKRQAEAAELHARLERQSLEARWELARDDLRLEHLALKKAQSAATQARTERERVEAELQAVGERREAAEEALTARSERLEELARRRFVAQSAEDRMAMRLESMSAAAAATQQRIARARELLGRLLSAEREDQPDGDADARIAALEAELATLQREGDAQLAEHVGELERQLVLAQQELDRQAAAVEEARGEREQSERELGQAREAIRLAEQDLERARRDAAEVGAELAAVNQFLRGHQDALAGAEALADVLEVDPGYELALSAALDGRLRAAVVSDRASAAELLSRGGADGGRTLVAGSAPAVDPDAKAQPVAGAELLSVHIRGRDEVLALARALLADTWIVGDVDEVPDTFTGIAVTRSGRVWSARTRELRQVAAHGDERVLAERNRRQQLVEATERAAQAEHAARAALERATNSMGELESKREEVFASYRAAVFARDDGEEECRRMAALMERRRAEGAQGESAARRSLLEGELGAERSMLARREHERSQRRVHGERLRAAITGDEALAPILESLLGAMQVAVAAIAERRSGFAAALSSDREAGEELTAQLRTCAQEEAAIHARLHSENESLTELEVGAQRVRDRVAEADELVNELAGRLVLAATPAEEPLSGEERDALNTRIERLAQRREQLGPVNPLAQEEYAEAVEHVEELERQRGDLESALRELEKLIADTDRQIRETFEQTFGAAARNFEELAAQMFPGGRGRLRLVSEARGPARVLGGENGDDPEDEASDPEEDELGVEIEVTPAGKEMKRLSLLSGGEKSMTALAFLFAVFLAKPCPFYILDEVEAALDDLNIDRFLALLRRYCKQAQFIVVTHQKRTMEAADSLYGVSMGGDGISKVVSRRLPPAELAA